MARYYSLEQIKSAVKITHEKYGGMAEEFDLLKLLQMPTADVVPVVRCKDCKHYSEEFYFTCRAHISCVKPDDFCSYGERKEDDPNT